MNWIIHVAASARKNLKRFPVQNRERILAVLKELTLNPYGGDLEKIGGELNTWRRRVGNYRIIFDIHSGQQLVEVRIIKRRTSSTY